jgi:hypothetical protein
LIYKYVFYINLICILGLIVTDKCNDGLLKEMIKDFYVIIFTLTSAGVCILEFMIIFKRGYF